MSASLTFSLSSFFRIYSSLARCIPSLGRGFFSARRLGRSFYLRPGVSFPFLFLTGLFIAISFGFSQVLRASDVVFRSHYYITPKVEVDRAQQTR